MTTSGNNNRVRLFIIRPNLGQGGAERVAITLLQHLDRTRYDLTLVLMRKEGALLQEVPADVPIIHLNAASLWSAWLPLIRLLRDLSPDVVLSLGGTDIPLSIARRLANYQGRVILSERSRLIHDHTTLRRHLLLLSKKLFYRWADLLTAVSVGVQTEMAQQLNVPPETIKVLPNPVSSPESLSQAMTPVEHPWFQENIPIILAVGRLVVQKDYPTLLQSFSEVRKQMPVRLVILGDGPLLSFLEEIAKSLGITDDVWFGGFQRNPFQFMRQSTLFVLSSTHEGLPGVLIQAMTVGAAVISTDCPHGPREIISRPGENGFLVPVGDPSALAEKIIFLLKHPQVIERMRRMAPDAVKKYRIADAIRAFDQLLLTDSHPDNVTLSSR